MVAHTHKAAHKPAHQAKHDADEHDPSHEDQAHEPVQPHDPSPAEKAEKEQTIQERAQGLLKQMTDSYGHNAPITPWMMSELAAVVSHVTGKEPVVVPHVFKDGRGLPDHVVFRKPDGTVTMINSSEEALAYVRSLPKDVQDRPHWKLVDRALVDANATVPNSDVSPAVRQFKWAVAEDERLNPRPLPKIADKHDDKTNPAVGAADAHPGGPGPFQHGCTHDVAI